LLQAAKGCHANIRAIYGKMLNWSRWLRVAQVAHPGSGGSGGPGGPPTKLLLHAIALYLLRYNYSNEPLPQLLLLPLNVI